MELHLEVVLSSSIKRKKPWPRFCWLGKEKESVFLLDDKRISEINMVSGRTKKKIPKIHPFLNRVVTMASSHNGVWLCGLLVSGELFLWNRDKDLLKTAPAVPEILQLVAALQGNATRLSLQVSGDGLRVLVVAVTGQVFLWECMSIQDLAGVRDGVVRGRWSHVHPLEDSILPSAQDKEASQHTIFVKTEDMGDSCLSAFVFTTGVKLIITCLKIVWEEAPVSSEGYNIEWVTKTYTMSCLTPPCKPVRSRGALVPAFSPDGRLLAVVLNQRQPKATQMLFVSTQNFVSVSSGLGGCGSKKLEIPSKYIRSYWVGSVCWSPDSLFLACVLKRGSLLMVSRLTGLLTLTSSGCSVDFGPAQFLPLHPLVTYRPHLSPGKGEASLSSSSQSVRDVLRQRYSVTWHPRLLYLIVSDGYMATVMRVLGKPSAALLLKDLLKNTTQDLEKASGKLEKSQGGVTAWLNSVSCLSFGRSLEEFKPNPTDSVLSTNTEGSNLPPFLQEQGTLNATKELLEKVQTFLEDDSDVDGPPAGSHLADGGRLEFASMFDTVHALDTQTDAAFFASPDFEKECVKTPGIHRELGRIQSKLLTAWAFAMSLGNTVENRPLLLKHNLCCMLRFAALLQLIPGSVVHAGKKKISVQACLLRLLKALLIFLPWDGIHSDGPHCLGLLVSFSQQLIRLLLTPKPESLQTGQCILSSCSLSTVLLILQEVSDSLDHAYSLQQRVVWLSAGKDSQPHLCTLDMHHVPQLQDRKEEKTSVTREAQPLPHRPSSRLLGVWQWVYRVTQEYVEELRNLKDCEGWEEEQHQLTGIMSQIQVAIQATGATLEEGPVLLTCPGEQLYLFGSYLKSDKAWRSQICEENLKCSDRRVFKDTQLCLALLYSLLSQYRLRDAQEFGDHMSRLILERAGHQKSPQSSDWFPCPWLPVDLHNDAARAVVQNLGRYMASYFTNQPLYVCPPHHVGFLPPLHLPRALTVGRLVPLCQEEVSRAVRQQQLSEVWTVEYAQDLLLLGGLLPESVWLAYHLGDWKTAVSLSLAYTNYCCEKPDSILLRRRELHLPVELEAKTIFQVELERLLGSRFNSQECKDDVSLTEPLEGQNWDVLQLSSQEILKASVMAGVDVISSPLSSLLDAAKTLCVSLPLLVPNGLYLPSPPLYCPQPSPSTQDHIGQFSEVALRHKVSGVLQRLLLLLRSAHCCHPAAQWYIGHLWHSRRMLLKMKKKYAYPSLDDEYVFPEGLKKVVTHAGFFRKTPDKKHLDSDTIHIITCFRELCALCWMLHIRDQLSVSCRKYQALRQHGRHEEIPVGPEMTSACVDALSWACRFLPFSCFLGVEEMLQDLLLSLLSELPSLSQVADTLVRAFLEEEESVRVPLREKYKSLLQRVKRCSVLEGDDEELLMTLIQDKRRLRQKHLRRLQRHLAPPELHLWEKQEEEEDRESKHGMALLRQLSLGTSLSSCTLSDPGSPQMCSEEDTEDNTSEAAPPETHCRATSRGIKAKRGRDDAKQAKAESKRVQSECHPGGSSEDEQPSPPVFGVWEFELEDEEYLNFLELFFSYVLEKGGADEGELPLLKSFSSKLKERELHSLTFDVLTTVHRRQRDTHHLVRKHPGSDPPVFRAGCCYKPVKQDVKSELQLSAVSTEEPISRAAVGKKGLFGQHQRSGLSLAQRMKRGNAGFKTNPFQSAFPAGRQSQSVIFGSSTSMEAAVELQQSLDPKLEAQFPQLGRLLEWMVRWADRRVLVPPNSHGQREENEGTAKEGVMIRVKASAPAILTSLSLLWHRHAALLGDDLGACIPLPPTRRTVTPVLQPDVDRKLERESSVDTGYPGSANTPITGIDDSTQQAEPFIGPPTHEAEDLASVRTPLFHEPHQVTLDAQQREASSQLCLHDLHVSPERADKFCGSEDLETPSSTSSGNIFGIQETSLKLQDLDFSKNAEDISSTSSLSNQSEKTQGSLTPESQDLPTVSSEAELSASAQMPLPNTPVDPPRLQSLPNTPVDPPRLQSLPNTPVDPPRLQSLPNTPVDPPRLQSLPTPPVDPPRLQSLPNTPVDPLNVQPQSSTTGAPASDFIGPDQTPFTQCPPLRQRLGEDLFRLVQNINYMSLMEVLGASYSNLQLAQQSYSLSQSNVNISQPNVPASQPVSLFPQPSTLPVQTAPQRQACGPQPGFSHKANMATNQAARHSTENLSSPGCHHPDHNQSSIYPPSTADAAVGHQDLQPLSVQAAELNFKECRSLIPPSQGLLATTDNGHDTSVFPPANANPQKEPAAQVWGVKILNLHPSATSHPASHYPPTQIGHATNPGTHTGSKWTEDKKTSYSIPKRLLSLISLPSPTQPRIEKSERTREQEFPLLPPVTTAHTPAPVQGLRLLRCTSAPQGNIMFPKIAPAPSPRPCALIAAPIREVPMLKLLQIQSGVRMMSPMVPPSASVTPLMSLEEEFKASVGRKQSAKAAQGQLHVTPNAAADTLPSCISSKRQKRREEKEGRSKTEVTFRPNDSIIPATQPVNEEPAAKEAVTRGGDASIPCGSSESLLTGQMLLDKAMSTSAELHAFASTCKNPPECHDAFTNTEPARSPVLVDKAVSVSSPTSQSPGNLKFCTEREKIPEWPEKDLVSNGRQFLSVVDLEGKTLHEDLPLHLSPGGTEFTPIYKSSPTSAQLHLLATSVLRSSAATSEPQPNVPVVADLQQRTTHTVVADESPSLSHIETNGDAEKVAAEEVKSELCRAINSQMVAPPRASSNPSTAWFSSHLTEMDAQLAAVQRIADSLEKDFSNTKMLVKSTETTSVSPLNVKNAGAVKKTVRLALPREAWTPRQSISSHASVFEDSEENLAKESVAPNKLWSFYPTSSQETRIEPDTSGISSLLEESENLGQSGLSDTFEILDELVREGFLSPPDLDWTDSQTEQDSRLDRQQTRWMPQNRTLQEDKRKELRTWMRKKQRERLAVYQKHRESLRQRENKPFSTAVTVKPKTKNLAAIQKMRVEKETNLLLEQYSQRTREACSLVGSISSNSVALLNSSMSEGPSLSKATRSSSALPPNDRQRDSSQTTCVEKNLDSGQGRSQSALWSAAKISDYRKRLGLHRPVTSLPKDRMSQVTRRGMLHDPRSQTKLHSANQSEERLVGHQRKMELSRSIGRTPAGRGIPGELTRMEEDNIMNVLESTSGDRNLLGPEEYLLDKDTGTRRGDADMDWLDNLSETSSCLSKIDWAAIDRMTAEA
ncbi:ciliogenesis and planar polarity effector 1 isoform X3 [Takifugu flavidus]|uniref:ciliogenesis and planar polarity effector 1 isoform X3 n=1 Tax=Takifugu flavidus TaxID=433684 RepID=UPI002544D222|nr:ciliogenesis and planar polarity effector 1 isoform X3 [Takifugu flavidus]